MCVCRGNREGETGHERTLTFLSGVNDKLFEIVRSNIILIFRKPGQRLHSKEEKRNDKKGKSVCVGASDEGERPRR